MDDPFARLLLNLQAVFNSVAIRNDKFTITPIQHLKEAVDNYNPQKESSFYNLIKALGSSMPYIQKSRVNINELINCMNQIAKSHNITHSEWHIILDRYKSHSPRFQFGLPPNEEQSLISWLSKNTGKPFNRLNHFEKTQMLVDYGEYPGFSSKLSAYLNKHPDFLLNLIMESEINFNKIANTRLSLYLTDKQIAETIIKHLPKMSASQNPNLDQVEQLILKIDNMLSSGRSVKTLLRNADAKEVLDNSVYFQIYQSNAYINRYQPEGNVHNTPPSSSKI